MTFLPEAARVCGEVTRSYLGTVRVLPLWDRQEERSRGQLESGTWDQRAHWVMGKPLKPPGKEVKG